MISVRFLGMNHLTNGVKELTFSASRVSEILEKMQQYPQIKERLFNPKTGKPYPEFMIVLNGRPIYDYTKRLRDGDEVAIMPISAGG